MGMSISSRLAYCLGPFEVGDEPWVGDDDTGEEQDWLLAHSGFELPVEPPEPKNWKDRSAPDYLAWAAWTERLREILDASGVELDYTGTEHWMEWYLVASCAPQKDTLDLKELLGTEADAHAKLAAFCARAGLSMESAGWRVIASYG